MSLTCCVEKEERLPVLGSRVEQAAKAIETAATILGWAEMFVIAQDLALEYCVKFDPEKDDSKMEFEMEGIQLIAYAAATRARAEWMQQWQTS